MTTHRSPRRGVVDRIGQVLIWSATAVIIAAIALAVVIPRFAGATPFSVLTGSMSPGMPAGSLVVTRPVAPRDVGVGTVITYQLESGRSPVVTHRVVGVGVDMTGERVFTTRGDANDVADAEPVRPVQIRGERWYSVPHLGRISNLFDVRQREQATFLVALGLLGYATAMFVGSRRERLLVEADAVREEGRTS